MQLRVDDDELAACVACGLCLPHCPTYRVTGEESASPRGRIAAMRAVAAGAAPDTQFVEFMDACVQCRGCETACPSSVPFGRLMEGTRATLAAETRYQPRWRRAAYAALGHHRLVLVGSTVLALAQRLRLVPRRVALPQLPLRRPRLRVSGARGGERVWLFTGCVMDAWQRHTHQATIDVLEAAGASVRLPGSGADCCGALHVHAGLRPQAERLAGSVLEAFPGSDPILVNSAGCGAQLQDYGHLLDSVEGEAFAGRVRDVHEWLAERIDRLPDQGSGPRPPVAVQDPCHLRHVQRAHLPVRAVLARYVEVVELDDEGLCCGAGGAYAAQHPDLAGAIRDRKLASIGRAGAPIVASANPGCAMHLAAAGVDARHPLDIVADAIGGTRGR